MTAPTGEQGPAPDDLLERLRGLDLELPEVGTGARSRHRALQDPEAARPVAPGPSRRWMTVFSLLLAMVVLAGSGLVYLGVQTLRDSSDGRNVSSVTDPSAPGFEAIVEPSPTALVLDLADDGSLRSVMVMALQPLDAGGSVVLIPPLTRPVSGDGAYSLRGLAQIVDELRELAPPIQRALDLGLFEVVELDDDRWADLVAPVGPLTVDNPTAVGTFPAGPVTVAAEEVGAWLDPVEGEDDLARQFRIQALLEAWVAAVSSSSDGAAAVPGEVDLGIGRFIRGLAGGPLRVELLPVEARVDLYGTTSYDIVLSDAAVLVGQLVPFPTGGEPDSRTRVRLLDGTGQAQHVAALAPLVVAADGQVVVAGNADRFDYASTEIRYHLPGGEADAERLRAALGGGEVVEDVRPTDAFDVTIVLGSDL